MILTESYHSAKEHAFQSSSIQLSYKQKTGEKENGKGYQVSEYLHFDF